jgi:ketosteroid isomerase-like protein
MRPEEVVLAQVEPWNAGDIEAALDLYSDDVVVSFEPALPPGSPDHYTGKDELRAWGEALAAMNFKMQIQVLKVDGNLVTTETRTWVDQTRALGIAPLVATEVYDVQDGKIKSWTWTLSDASLAQLQAAMAPTQAEQLATPFNEAMDAGDIDQALDLLADDAVIQLIPPPIEGDDGIFSGKAEIRPWYEALVSFNGVSQISDVAVEGDRLTALLTYTDDSITGLGVDSLDYKWVVTVSDGKIQRYTATMTDESRAKMQAAVAASAPSPGAEVTVTFRGDQCTFDGPEAVPAGRVTVNWKVEGQPRDGYALAIVTLDGGKTFEDLDAWPSVGRPPWAYLVGFQGSFSADLSPFVSDVTKGPIYLVCFTAHPEARVSVLGPVEVGD